MLDGSMDAAPLLVALLPETGHLNPSFKLSRELQRRGHDVRYLVPRELSAYVAAQGFAVEPFFPELDAGEPAPGGRLAMLHKRRAITARFRAVSERLASRGPNAFSRRPAL